MIGTIRKNDLGCMLRLELQVDTDRRLYLERFNIKRDAVPSQQHVIHLYCFNFPLYFALPISQVKRS